MAEIMCPECGMVNTVHTVLHNFRLERVLGVGGMSVVLQARDMVLNRTLAVKVLKDSYRDNPDRVARFEKECALMARVRHPNVVSVYSAGEAHGQFYIAMELVEGQNLELMVSPFQPMAPLRALSIVRQVARGLSAANKAGLLHRDIKPGNVLVTRAGRAKVLDFGLSLGKEDADTEETIWATPFYVPPETLLRQPEDVRTDIYALGMTLRFLLSGCENFPNVPQSAQELLESKKNLPRPVPAEFGIDESYADLVEHMTAYDINKRPTGYEDLLQEIDEVHKAQRAYEFARSPIGKAKRSRRQFVYGIIVCLLGMISALIAYFVCEPEPQHKALIAPNTATYAGKDEQQLVEAENLLNQEQYEQSAEAFIRLAREAEEPAIGAWAALVARYYANCDVCGEQLIEAEHLLEKHLTNASSGSSAGEDSIAQMRIVQEAAKHPALDHVRFDNKSPLNAMLQVARMKYFASQNDTSGVEVQREKVAEVMEMTPPPYSHLATLLKSWNMAAHTPKVDYEAQLKDAIDRYDFVKIQRLCDMLAKGANMEMSRRLEAYHEMAKVGEAVDTLLQKKYPSEFSSEMPIEKKLVLLQRLNNPRLLGEMRTLYSLLQSDLKTAMDNNPYRQHPDSVEPFASLLERWFVRLAPVQKNNFQQSWIYLISLREGIKDAQVKNKTVCFTDGTEYSIVASSDYSLTLQVKERDGETQLVDYVCMYGDHYCELPGEDATARWIDIIDEAWRGPCCLQGKKLVRPMSYGKTDTATILHRDENSILVHWDKYNVEDYYVRAANGTYLKKNTAKESLHLLMDKPGKSAGLVELDSKQGRLFYSPNISYPVPIKEKTKDSITIGHHKKDETRIYKLADDGLYHLQESEKEGAQ